MDDQEIGLMYDKVLDDLEECGLTLQYAGREAEATRIRQAYGSVQRAKEVKAEERYGEEMTA